MSEPGSGLSIVALILTGLSAQFLLGVITGQRMHRRPRCLACTIRVIRAYIGGRAER